ncbi:MAG TPA: hypothetical protein VHK28_09340, partial [Candidatus Limnocylindria bacterium]|nr:hypothetical protein [Candidatus Limnocylindria bacterium]
MLRRLTSPVVLLLLAAAVTVLIAIQTGFVRPYEAPTAFVDRWLQAIVGRGAEDRGWSQLGERTRESFGSAEEWVAAASAQDWSTFRWEVGSPHALES